jgi:hypothetical protein
MKKIILLAVLTLPLANCAVFENLSDVFERSKTPLVGERRPVLNEGQLKGLDYNVPQPYNPAEKPEDPKPEKPQGKVSGKKSAQKIQE